LALAREVLAADALAEGRLVKLSPLAIPVSEAAGYHLVYPSALRDWAPLARFRGWLHDELDRSRRALETPAPRRRAPPAAARAARRSTSP
ncbi:MAG TPA: LysR family transcriptional regulator, partial [Albitalea sp.]